MKLWIIESIAPISSRWHSGGGLVVVADTEERARLLVEQHRLQYRSDGGFTEEEWAEEAAWRATAVYELAEFCGEKLFVFPDAGCC